MSETLAAAAATLGVPESLVERSAKARAAATGGSVDDILQAWAGGGAAPAATAAAPAVESAESAPAAAEEATIEDAPTEAAPTPAEAAPVPAAAGAGAGGVQVVQGPPPPESVSLEEAAEWEVVTTVPSVGIKERTNGVVPSWLMAFFVVIPIMAVGYITVGSAGPECGEAGQLAVNFRNELVNCDLTAYEGAGGPGGGGGGNLVAAGADVYAANCASCHMPNGAGGAAGPQLSGGSVLATFSGCGDHITWVELGTAGWTAQIGSTYGDTAKPTGGFGNMPGFGQALSADQLAQVVLYERVVFGGASAEEALVDCGLAAGEAPDGTTPDGTAPDGTAPDGTAPGGSTPTETTAPAAAASLNE